MPPAGEGDRSPAGLGGTLLACEASGSQGKRAAPSHTGSAPRRPLLSQAQMWGLSPGTQNNHSQADGQIRRPSPKRIASGEFLRPRAGSGPVLNRPRYWLMDV